MSRLRGDDVSGERTTHAAELERLRRDLEEARKDRDHVATLLVEAEQRIATLIRELQERDAACEARVEQLEREVDDLRSSTSWKATAGLRAISGALRGRK